MRPLIEHIRASYTKKNFLESRLSADIVDLLIEDDESLYFLRSGVKCGTMNNKYVGLSFFMTKEGRVDIYKSANHFLEMSKRLSDYLEMKDIPFVKEHMFIGEPAEHLSFYIKKF